MDNEDITVWDLLDSIGARKIDKALQIFDELLSRKVPSMKILTMIHSRLNKLYNCKVAILQNEDVSKVLALKPCQEFLIPKYKRETNNFTEEELNEVLKVVNALKLIYENTSGKDDLGTVLKEFLGSI